VAGQKTRVPHSQVAAGKPQTMSLFTDPKDLTLSQRETEGTLQPEGILPIAKSILTEWGFEWVLPGNGLKYSDCGDWRSRGWLNVEKHVQQGLDQDMAGKVFVRRYQRTCMRAECPVCYESGAGKEA